MNPPPSRPESLPTLSLAVWGPVLVVLVVSLVAWGSAMRDRDALAVWALHTSVVLAVFATLPSWLLVKRWQGFASAAAAKIGCFLLLAPYGPATLLLDHTELLASLREAGLRYFWVTPPVLLAITAIEAWLIRLRGSGRRIEQTRVWRRRRVLLALLLAGATAVLAWRLGRVEYYLWRMRVHDHAPSSYGLQRVGPGALPRIYRELEALGDREVGEYRGDLVQVLSEIRHEMVGAQTGRPRLWDVQAALVEPDPALVAALGAALEHEPNPEARGKLGTWLNNLDFNTLVEVFCRAAPRVPAPTRQEMIVQLSLNGIVDTATLPHDAASPTADRSTDPWRDLSPAEIERRQAVMRDRLACVPPVLVEALEADADARMPDEEPFWATQAVELLGQLRPLAPGLGARLYALMPRVREGYIVYKMLRALGPELATGPHTSLQEAVAAVYLTLPHEETRKAVATWAQSYGQAAGVDASRMFCGLFPGATARERETVFTLIAVSPPPADPCVLTTIMAAYEEAALAGTDGDCSDAPKWMLVAEYWLRKQRSDDPRVAAWAGSLAPRVVDTCRAEALRRLAPEQAPNSP